MKKLSEMSKTLRECAIVVKSTWNTSNRSEKAGMVVAGWIVSSIILSPIVGTIVAKKTEHERQQYLASPEYAALVVEEKKQAKIQEQERLRQQEEYFRAQREQNSPEKELERYQERQREKCFERAVENKHALRDEGWSNEFSQLAGLALAGCE
jgi:hypothetical protein